MISAEADPQVLTIPLLFQLRGLVPRRPLRHYEALRIAELQANHLLALVGVGEAGTPSEVACIGRAQKRTSACDAFRTHPRPSCGSSKRCCVTSAGDRSRLHLDDDFTVLPAAIISQTRKDA